MTIKERIEQLSEELKGYVELRAELLQLEATKKIAALLSGSITAILLSIILLISILFASFWSAFVLSEHLGQHLGFACVAGFYLLLFGLLYMARRSLLKEPLREILLRSMLEKELKSEEDPDEWPFEKGRL